MGLFGKSKEKKSNKSPYLYEKSFGKYFKFTIDRRFRISFGGGGEKRTVHAKGRKFSYQKTLGSGEEGTSTDESWDYDETQTYSAGDGEVHGEHSEHGDVDKKKVELYRKKLGFR